MYSLVTGGHSQTQPEISWISPILHNFPWKSICRITCKLCMFRLAKKSKTGLQTNNSENFSTPNCQDEVRLPCL